MPAFFYLPKYDASQATIAMEPDSSKHMVQVLRLQPGDSVQLTDGKGLLILAEITKADKKNCILHRVSETRQPSRSRQVRVGISLLKNAGRLEWFLEKAAELGVTAILPMRCARTEKQEFRLDRMNSILVSAMLQSQQAWLTELQKPLTFTEIIRSVVASQKYIAHCAEGNRVLLSDVFNGAMNAHTILIGPEGDFTLAEITLAIEHSYIPVLLGQTRLRSETAALAAASVIMLC